MQSSIAKQRPVEAQPRATLLTQQEGKIRLALRRVPQVVITQQTGCAQFIEGLDETVRRNRTCRACALKFRIRKQPLNEFVLGRGWDPSTFGVLSILGSHIVDGI
jgi:hypothetical protein